MFDFRGVALEQKSFDVESLSRGSTRIPRAPLTSAGQTEKQICLNVGIAIINHPPFITMFMGGIPTIENWCQ